MKRILVCIKEPLSCRMLNSYKKIVKQCDYRGLVCKLRLLGMSYNSIPIKPANMNRVAVLMQRVKSI